MLPQEIQEKLSHLEEDYFKKHSASLKSYMSKLDLDLAVVSFLCLCVLQRKLSSIMEQIHKGNL